MQSPMVNSPDRRRQVCRFGVDFQLSVARLITEAIDRDLLSSMILLAIARANLLDVARDPMAIVAYQGMEGVVPDEMRRPVSVYAIARQLNTPYETVRRHVVQLKDAELCESVGRGVVAPGRVFFTARWMTAADQAWKLAVKLVEEAASCGIGGDAFEWPATPDVRRQVARSSVDFFLSGLSLERQPKELDVTSILVLRAVAAANVRHLTEDPIRGAMFAALSEIPDDGQRRPVSVYAVSKSLAVPYETARRIANKLTTKGLVERWEEGLVVPNRVLSLPVAMDGFIEFAALTETFLARLASLGVKPGGLA